MSESENVPECSSSETSDSKEDLENALTLVQEPKGDSHIVSKGMEEADCATDSIAAKENIAENGTKSENETFMETDDQDTEDFDDKPESENEAVKKEGENSSDQPIQYFSKKILKYKTPASSLEPLPEGWIAIHHNSGIPVYLHKQTKVVTWSRPYVVGVGSVRRHNPPVVSIPCLEYKKTLDKIQAELTKKTCSEVQDKANGIQSNEEGEKAKEAESSSENSLPVPKAILHNNQNEICDEDVLSDYLNQLFKFDVIDVPRFNKWSEKRQFAKKMRQETSQNGEDSEDKPKKLGPAKVITVTIPRESGSDRPQKVAFNTSIKPMVCVLHEYAQSVLRTKPHFVFATNDDSSQPFKATIMINDKIYGEASGINKKTAKNKAALATMEMLVPGFKDQVESLSGETSVEYFNDVSVTDPRVYELCVHAGNYLPYQLLTECLKRNQGIADTSVNFQVQNGKGKNVDFKMECGKHVVKGTAKNKKIGKQNAAQQVLQLLHPNVSSWGELIRMYGTSVAEKRAKKKNMEQEIFELKQRRSNAAKSSSAPDAQPEDKPAPSLGGAGGRELRDTQGPNPELLAKLRNMMAELGEKRRSNDRSESDASAAKRSKLLEIDV